MACLKCWVQRICTEQTEVDEHDGQMCLYRNFTKDDHCNIKMIDLVDGIVEDGLQRKELKEVALKLRNEHYVHIDIGIPGPATKIPARKQPYCFIMTSFEVIDQSTPGYTTMVCLQSKDIDALYLGYDVYEKKIRVEGSEHGIRTLDDTRLFIFHSDGNNFLLEPIQDKGTFIHDGTSNERVLSVSATEHDVIRATETLPMLEWLPWEGSYDETPVEPEEPENSNDRCVIL